MGAKIRVAMLGPYPMDGMRVQGGVQAAFTYLVKGLARSNELDLHVLTLKPGTYTGPKVIERENYRIHLLPVYPRFERVRNYRTYQSLLDAELAPIQPDLIHAQDAASDALVALRSGYPAVITVHGIRWEDGKHYSSLNKRMRVYFDSFFTERYAIQNTHHLIAISHYVTSYFEKLMRPDVSVYYVPNAIDESFFHLSRSENGQNILFAGRVIPRKRVMDLVRSFAQVHSQAPSARLRIAGEITTEPEYVAAIRQWVHQSDLDRYVDFLGPLSEASIFHEFESCSVLVLPSAQETAPMVIAQAMAARVPVVATRVGGVGEMLGENSERGLLVKVGDIDGLASAQLRLLRDPELRAELGQKGRVFAEENYHIDSVARRTLEVYRQIVKKQQPIHV